MMQAVRVIYDGEKFVPEEEVHLAEGQEAIVTFMEDVEYTPKKMSEEEIHAWVKKYSGGAGNLFKNTESVDEYLAKLRKERNLNLEDYMGVGEKMFATTEDVDNYVKDLRIDDRF
ncbi:MAG: DUF104 domain-containing protein [Selenomonadaceae bacterium]|nr:DUF104 domain-containing protein [Selenomonadaceae bacterium]